MTTAGQSDITPPRSRNSLLRAIALRILLYTVLCAIVALSLIDLSSLHRSDPATPAAPDSPTTSGPGWPHHRGPTYDAHSTEIHLADAWPANGPPVLWNREIGAGYSGLIAQGNRVYAQTQALTQQKILALDADTGRTIWERDYGWPYQPGGMFPGPRATPTLAAGRLYFAAPDGVVGCLDAADGRPVWSLNVLEKFAGRGADFGYACSPVVEDGLVILPVGGPSASVIALDAATGATRWTSGAAPASYSSALPITFRGRRQVVAFLQNALASFDLPTGRLLWEEPYARGFDEHAAAPLYREPYLRTMQAYRAGSDLYELKPTTQPATAPSEEKVPAVRADRIRHDAGMSNDIASSVLVDGFVYGFDLREMQASGGRTSRGTFRCMNFMTGQVTWSSDRPGQSAIVVADGKLLMLNDASQALLVRADPTHYDELARAEVFPGETCWTAPALDAGRLFLRSPTRAACLFVGHPENMTPRQRQASSSPAASTPRAAARPTWLVGAERDYPFEMPDLRELTRWYLYAIAAFAIAALLSGLMHVGWRLARRDVERARRAGLVTFFAALFALGLLATPFANHRHPGAFVFTWPLALVAAHQVALAAVSRRLPSKPSTLATLIPLAGVTLLLVTCLAYFKLTRQLNLAPAWYFLAALPATWPLAIPAARRLTHPGRLLADLLWILAIVTLHFAAAGAVMLFRTALLERAAS